MDEQDAVHDEYDFTGVVRGKYAARMAEGTNLVFRDSASVNEALRLLTTVARQQTKDVTP